MLMILINSKKTNIIVLYNLNGGLNMMYPYMILADETEILHSHIIEADGILNVEVHFERPTEEGFDIARCILPTYSWIKKEGYSNEEVAAFEQFLQNNAHLLYKYAASGGVQIA